MLSGCKDKYEKALEEVTSTSIPVRKCELKELANEKPKFSCGKTEHRIAIERARSLGIKESRIKASINIGKLQVNQISRNLINKSNYLKSASEYKSNADYENERSSRKKSKLIWIETAPPGSKNSAYFDWSDPFECKMIDKYRDRNTCIARLNESIKSSEINSSIWIKKAEELEAKAGKIESEY